MNVLLVSSKYMPEYSGSGYRAHNLYRRLTVCDPDMKVYVISGSETENICANYEYDGFKVRRISCKPFPDAGRGFLRALKISMNFHSEYAAATDYIKTLPRPDLIHIFGKNYVTAAALNYSRVNGIPAVIELCNEMDTPLQYIPIANRFEASSRLPEKYHFICISERLRNTCLKNNIPEDNLWCRPNPVDESRFKPVEGEVKGSLRKKLSKFSDADIVVTAIANFIPRKNHRLLVEAIRLLPEQFKLFLGGPIVGSGPLTGRDSSVFNDLARMVAEYGLDARVQITRGFIENMEEYYQMTDVYAFPSLSEGLGTPILESVACGVPVAANLIPGITDFWIRDGENGYVSRPSPEVFAENIRKSSSLPRQQMIAESGRITSIAGTQVIDKAYYSLIGKMTS
ncbi:MAG: glycosyltransferase family 4 protein [Victivallales bacterium]